jgi:hypothetical protein
MLNLSLRVLPWDEEDWVACEAALGIASVFQTRDPIKMENVSFRRRSVWRDELAIIASACTPANPNVYFSKNPASFHGFGFM